MLTRKHFITAAKMLKDNKVEKESTTYQKLVECFKAENPRFDVVRFEKAVFDNA